MAMTRLFITSIVIIICGSQCIDALRILMIFPLHAKSHFMMAEKLAKELAARGHQVDVYSQFPQKRPVPNYTDYFLEGSMPAILNNMSYDFIKHIGKLNSQVMFDEVGNKLCELMGTPVFQELFKSLKKKQPYDIVMVEVFLSNCYLAWGRFLKIPMVGMITSAIFDWVNQPLGNPHNTAVHSSIWSHFYHPMDFWERLANTFLYYFNSITTPYSMKAQNKYIEQYFGNGYPDASEIIKDLDLVLVNMHHSIDGIRAFTPAVVPIAGLHITHNDPPLPQEVQKWLDESKNGCIYVSFGSMTTIESFPKPVLDTFYETFKKISPVRVLMKIAKPKELPPGLPSNVMTQKWFSQIEVLKHKNIKAFVTHGGILSTQESLIMGVPMIGAPLFADQYINIKSQVKRRVAVMIDVELEDFDVKIFYSAIKEILENPIYKKNAERFSKDFFDRPVNPMDAAIFWMEYIVRHGKQALRSPMVDMPWWEVNLIDVYVFVLLILFVVLYATKIIAKKVLSVCCSTSSTDKRKKE